jgi:GTPase Era involved in 16S rRNA processing
MSTSDLPVIAILGDVNHGKSSVVATLAEDDSVGIGAFPTTTHCQRFRVRDLLEFVDTPGFQNAREALRELKEAGTASNPLAVFREFVARHKDDRFFVHEVRLLQPVLEGASLLYVVDVSQPLEPRHEAETEILRLTGAPRIALLNQTGEPKHRAEWEARLRQNFSTVIDFNAHRADFSNRLSLLEALATVDLAGKAKLRKAIEVLQRDRDDKLDTTARIIIDLLADLLTCKHVEALRDPMRVASQQREVEERFREKLIAREIEAHREIIRTFAHQRVAVSESGPREWLSDGLFVERTWSLLGLSGWRLLAAGAGGGALVGAKIDLMFGGATWGLGAAVGGAIGGGAALAGSRTAPGFKARVPYFSRAIVGTELVAGPIKHDNFPWIVLDRALGIFVSVSHRAHARQDRETLDAAALAMRLQSTKAGSDQAPDDLRKALAKAFRDMRKERFTDDRRDATVDALREWLREISL